MHWTEITAETIYAEAKRSGVPFVHGAWILTNVNSEAIYACAVGELALGLGYKPDVDRSVAEINNYSLFWEPYWPMYDYLVRNDIPKGFIIGLDSGYEDYTREAEYRGWLTHDDQMYNAGYAVGRNLAALIEHDPETRYVRTTLLYGKTSALLTKLLTKAEYRAEIAEREVEMVE